MLLSRYAVINWNSKNKRRYVDLGYTFTKMKDSFEVKVEDLSDSSFATITVKCDYCGKEYEKTWVRYVRENQDSEIHTDCCRDCKKHKIIETAKSKYGVSSVLSLETTKKKICETNLAKYGVENPFQSEEIKETIKQSNIQKYGAPSPMQTKQVIAKVSETCHKKYGVPFYICTQNKKGEDHPRWKGGVVYHRHERSTYDYLYWRKSVFERDRYTCKCCGARNGNGQTVILHAHHIKNWKDHPNIRYNLENGITLCSACHLLFHSIFGKKDNNEVQLENFFISQDKKVC